MDQWSGETSAVFEPLSSPASFPFRDLYVSVVSFERFGGCVSVDFLLFASDEKTPPTLLKSGLKHGRHALTMPRVNSAWVQILAGTSSPARARQILCD